jgi:hypothetical protein
LIVSVLGVMDWATVLYPSLLNLERQRINSAVDRVNFGARFLSGEKLPSGPWSTVILGEGTGGGP